MKISLNWLKKYIDLSEKAEKIADIFTEHAFETTVIKNGPSVSLDKIFVGEVLVAAKHPNADRLTLTKTRVGKKDYAIICGAPNVRTGLKVAVAFPGTEVIGKDGQVVKLEKATIRGVESEGMLCSERELGLGTGHDGIMELPVDIKSGEKLVKLFPKDDILELDVLPDRAADCSSYFGIARELGALLSRKVKLPKIETKTTKKGKLGFDVLVQNTQDCPRYIATIIDGIKNGPSPEWMQESLRATGLKPQNLIVDTTNYVLWEIGQPTHAFDAAAISGSLAVRDSKTGEKIRTLDDIERDLPAGTLLISSNNIPVAIAGVMGGKESAVKPETTKIVLESALFASRKIRQFVNKTNLRTDASDRYMRGLTIEHAAVGAARVTELLQKYGGGRVSAQLDFYKKKNNPILVSVEHEKIESVLGIKVAPAKVVKILKSLGFDVSVKGHKYVVKPPILRGDITIEENVIEEVGRVLGYENLPMRLPESPITPIVVSDILRDTRKVQNVLQGAGWLEAYFYSVMNENVVNAVGLNREEYLQLVNPVRDDQKVLRQSLVPNLLSASETIIKKESIARIFEVGHVYPKKGDEQLCVAGVIIRRGQADHKDFYEIKGVVEYVLASLNLPAISFRSGAGNAQEKWLDPDASANIYCGPQKIGSLGEISDDVLAKMNIRGGVTIFEINLSKIGQIERLEKVYNPPFPYPTVQRDISLLLPENVLVDQVEEAIEDLGKGLVQDVDFVDLYDEDDQRSITLRVVYGSREKTLTDLEVNNLQKRILVLVAEKLGVKERGV
jgi:phenylalanyl-tRNA synthetase beta chain